MWYCKGKVRLIKLYLTRFTEKAVASICYRPLGSMNCFHKVSEMCMRMKLCNMLALPLIHHRIMSSSWFSHISVARREGITWKRMRWRPMQRNKEEIQTKKWNGGRIRRGGKDQRRILLTSVRKSSNYSTDIKMWGKKTSYS